MVIFNENNEKLEPFKSEGGIELFDIQEGVYNFTMKMADARSIWTPISMRDHMIRQWWNPTHTDSNFQYGSPIFATIDGNGNNVVTVCLLDSVKTSRLSFSVDDLSQKDEFLFRVETKKDGVFQKKVNKNTLRIDTRKIPYYDAIREATEFMRGNLRFLAKVPENAQLPLYSSWYNFHQNPTQDLLTKELDVASKMGFKTVILDDGWQFETEVTGDYYLCGDRHIAENKFPDFKAFCDHVHELGMKLIMWFPVPFVGYNTNDFKRFESKFALKLDAMRAAVLDVRYKECRDFIIGNFEYFVDKYGVDGLKLDFVDALNIPQEQIPPKNDEMDHESLNYAALTLMDEIYDRMTARDPDFLIEFRQFYIGAEMINHANMIRVCDCAYDSATNRLGIALLRLVNNTTAVHSDMLLWAKDETCDNVARQLLDVMFAVPQISVLLTKTDEKHKVLVGNFVSYWTENRDIILHGKFMPGMPDYNYEIIAAEKDGKRISVLYGTNVFELSGLDEDVFNATARTYVLAAETDKADTAGMTYRIYDYFKNVVEEGDVGTKRQFTVPVGGMLRIKRN